MAKLTDKEIREFFKKILDNLNKTIEDTNIALNNHEKRLKRLEKQKRKK